MNTVFNVLDIRNLNGSPIFSNSDAKGSYAYKSYLYVEPFVF